MGVRFAYPVLGVPILKIPGRSTGRYELGTGSIKEFDNAEEN
jgi:hypothetical protein